MKDLNLYSNPSHFFQGTSKISLTLRFEKHNVMNKKRDFEYYINCFTELHTMKKTGKQAPHKALLLLSVIDLVERGIITDCKIPLTNELIQQFKQNTSKLLGESILFQPKITYPFYHLRSEPFWQLIPNDNSNIDKINNYSLTNLRNKIAYARIDEELFDFLKNPNVRAKLRVTLIATYLNNQPTLADNLSIAIIAFSYLTSIVA